MQLLRYIGRRLMHMALTIIGISIISFATVYFLPGDPVSSRYPQLTASERAAVRASMGLDAPLHVRYIRYIQSLIRGDLGTSFNTGQRVATDFKARFPASLELALSGLLLAIVTGIPLGIIAAVRQNTWIDHATRFLSVSALSIPVFWLGLILIFLFFYVLEIAPAPLGRLGLNTPSPPTVTGLYLIDCLLVGDTATFRTALRYLALPAVTLALSIIAPIMRITRAAMIDALRQDYVTTARALGLPERSVVLRDALGNSSLPILTICGYLVTVLVAGGALVEQVFSWPGIGLYAIQAVVTTDYAVVQGFLLVIALSVVLVNFVVDLVYALIDPRIRYS